MPGRAQTSRIIWGLVAGALVLLTTAGRGEAQDWGLRGHGGGGPLLGVPLRSLNLTPDQQTQVRSILSASFTTARPLFQQLRQTESVMADALLASPTADVSAQLATINGLRSQLLQNRAQTTAQVLGVLTPDQLARAAQIRAQLNQLRGQMRQLLGPGGP
jgi:Spy/CpxP family protein refolding chaperone